MSAKQSVTSHLHLNHSPMSSHFISNLSSVLCICLCLSLSLGRLSHCLPTTLECRSNRPGSGMSRLQFSLSHIIHIIGTNGILFYLCSSPVRSLLTPGYSVLPVHKRLTKRMYLPNGLQAGRFAPIASAMQLSKAVLYIFNLLVTLIFL